MTEAVTLELPQDLVKHWRSKRDLTEEVKRSLVLDLMKKHKMSFRQGARLLKMEYWDFLDFMSKEGVPIIDYQPGEIKRDVETLRRFRESR
jgi:predicted HTH domain antitoxin